MILSRAIFTGMVVCFLLPVFAILFVVPQMSWPPWNEFLSMAKVHVLQSLLSAFMSVFLGLVSGYGLFFIASPIRRLLAGLLLLPMFLPVVVGSHYVMQSFIDIGWLPYGFTAVVLMHVILNAPIVAVWWSETLLQNASGWLAVAEVNGASIWLTAKVLCRELWRNIFYMLAFVGVLSFLTFPVALMFGFQSWEVYLYQLILLPEGLGAAVALAMVTIFLLLILYVVLPQGSFAQVMGKSRNYFDFRYWRQRQFLVSVAVFLLLPLIYGFFRSLWDFKRSLPVGTGDLVMNTLAYGWLVGVVLLGWFYLLLWCFPMAGRLKWFAALTLSYSLLGFLLWQWAVQIPGLVFYLLALGFVLLTIPVLLRWKVLPEYLALGRQVEMAQVMSASHRAIVQQVLWPQLRSTLLFLSGLGGFWACGEFALFKYVFSEAKTLPMLLESQVLRYQLQEANTTSLLLLAVSSVVFFSFWGWSFVSRQ